MPERAQSNTTVRGARRQQPSARANARRTPPAPILVRHVRGDVAESVHRGHVVEVDASGTVVRSIGDPEHVVALRSTVKPLGLVALIEAGGVEAFDLTDPEIAVLASSHSGEDLHVRTLQGILRRARIPQSALACGVANAPLDALTAARLARDGERPSEIRHNCSGNHVAILLISRLGDWPLEGYWEPGHPAMRAFASALARVLDARPERLPSAIDNCGIPTWFVALREVAAAYARLAGATTGDSALDAALRRIRDAMMRAPELVGGTRDRLDTVLMKAVPERLVSKSGAEALRALGRVGGSAGAGIAIKIEDGDGADRAGRAVAVETLSQVGVLGDAQLRQLGRYHRPPTTDPHGRIVAEAVPAFDLAPVGELV